MKTILVDQDGVLADWEKKFNSLLAREHPHIPIIHTDDRRGYYLQEQYEQEHREALSELMNHPELYATLEPIEGSLQAMSEMRDAGFDVAICTAPYITHNTCASDKIAWVIKHLGLDWAKSMVLTNDKTRVMGDVLIDDKADIKGMQKPVWQHIVFDTPYNREIKDVRTRLHHWSQWQEVLLPILS